MASIADPLAWARGRRVEDVMLAEPKTLAADTPVAQVRRLFEDEHLMTALVVEGSRFCGVLEREDVAGADPAAHASALARPVETVAPADGVEAAIRILDASGGRRVVVLDPDGSTLRGLVCLTRDRAGFCTGSC